MGTDINVILEEKNDNGEWKCIDDCVEKTEMGHFRDYELFGLLSGVRNGKKYLITPLRGIPKDASQETKEKMENAMKEPNYEGFTWYFLDELIEIIESLPPNESLFQDNRVKLLHDWLRKGKNEKSYDILEEIIIKQFELKESGQKYDEKVLKNWTPRFRYSYFLKMLRNIKIKGNKDSEKRILIYFGH